MTATVKKILAQNKALEPVDQKTLCRVAATYIGKIDRIVDRGLTDPSPSGQLGYLEPAKRKLEAQRYAVMLAELRRDRDTVIAYLQKHGTMTSGPRLAR